MFTSNLNKSMKYLLCTLLLISITGCSNGLNFSKRPPDEFSVLPNPPLYIPPNFDLKAPKDNNQVKKDKNIPLSKSESAFINYLTSDKKNTDVDDYKKEKKGLVRNIISGSSNDSAIVVNPYKEKERLEKNKINGKAVNVGITKPIKEGPSTLDKLLGSISN